MIVDEVVTAVDNLFGNDIRRALGLRTVRFARIRAVHALVIDGIDVRNFLFEGRDVHKRNENDRARDLNRIELSNEFFNRDDGSVFRAVGSGNQRKDSAGLCAVHDRSEEHTSELQSQSNLVCRLLLEKKKKKKY